MARFSRWKVVWLGLWLVCTLVDAPRASAQIGGLDATFSPGAILNGTAPGSVRALVVQSDAKVVIAGDFTSVAGVARGRIARLNADGSLDTTFASGAGADGPINAIVQSAGNFVIGGEFLNVDGSARSRIARLTTLGALDTAFTVGSGANGSVYAILINSSGIHIGGDFTQINGTNRGRLARLTTSGSLDSAFLNGVAGFNGPVYALIYDQYASYTLYAGGAYTAFNGQSRNRLAALSSGGSLDPAFNASGGPDGAILAMLFPSPYPGTRQLYIAGEFTAFGTSARDRLAMLTIQPFGAPTLDTKFKITTDARVRCLAFQPDARGNDRLLIGGDFTSVNTQSRSRIARLYFPMITGSGSEPLDVDPTFNSPEGANAPVRVLRLTSVGKPVLGGDFSAIAGAPSPPVARLYTDYGSQLPPTPTSFVAEAVSTTQVFVIFGGSTQAATYRVERSTNGTTGWVPATFVSTLYLDGGLEPGSTYFYRAFAVNPNGDSPPTPVVTVTTPAMDWMGAGAIDPSAAGSGASGEVRAVALQPNGKVILGGSFTTMHGVARTNLARLLPDWTVDPDFNPTPNASVSAVAIQPDGRVVIGGSFTQVAGIAQKYVARLNSDGSLDSTFALPGSGPSSSITHLGLQPDGGVIIAGFFSAVSGASHPYLARLARDGTLDASFTAALDFRAEALSVQRDGRILLGGFFSKVSGVSVKYVTRLMPGGAVDPSFSIGQIGAFVKSVIPLNNGQVLAGGSFATVNGAARKGVVRLNANGTNDPTFDPGNGPDGTVRNIAAQSDGKVVIAGDFYRVGGVVRLGIARLNGDGTLDPSFNPGAGTLNPINAVTALDDLRLVVGGYFTSFGKAPSGGVVRLRGDSFSPPVLQPSQLSVVAVSSSSLLVSWADQPAEQRWELQRSADGLGGWSTIATLPWDVTSFADGALEISREYFYRVRAANFGNTSEFSAVASGRTLSLFEQWKVENGLPFGAPAASDDDHDGIPLILEYSLALNPNGSSSAGLPTAQTTGGVLEFGYSKLRNDIDYAVEASGDLTTWSVDGVDQGSGDLPTARKAINGANRMYLRLRVSPR